MITLRKLMHDIADIRAAVNAAREYSMLASQPHDSTHPLEAVLPE